MSIAPNLSVKASIKTETLTVITSTYVEETEFYSYVPQGHFLANSQHEDGYLKTTPINKT